MRSICGFLFLQAVFIGFARHTKVTATRHCPKFTSCIDSYADIYKSLASEENSFNIESALYPAMTPSSLVVKVEFITHNETSVANYTWSLNCLYVAIPPQVLQLLSLGSVLVEPRTQELKICIPYFCRNFSSTKEQNDLMRDVLAAVRNFTFSVWYFVIYQQICKKKRFSAKWIFYQTSALMTTDNSVLSVHEQIFAGDIITYATSSCHNVFNFSSFQHFCKGEVCDL